MLTRSSIRFLLFLLLPVLMIACDAKQEASPEPAGRWQKIVEIHPQDRTKVVQMMITADEKMPTQKDTAALVLSCQKGDTDAYIIWRQYLGTYDPKVTWRAGSAPEVTETWSLSTDNEAIFSPDAIRFIKEMMLYDILLIKTSPFSSEPMTLVFDTSNLDQEITDLRKACKW